MMFKKIDKIQQRDACLALVFLILLAWLFWHKAWLVYTAMVCLLLGMVWPAAMRPFAWFWFGLSRTLGGVMSSVLLVIIWLCLVLPAGLARRLLGKDSLNLRKWRGGGSAFAIRNHEYGPEDLKHPY